MIVNDPAPPVEKQTRRAHAVLVGQRINLRPLLRADVMSTSPLTLEVSGGGMAVLFRFGVVVFFDVAPLEQNSFLEQLSGMVTDALPEGETESLEVVRNPQGPEGLIDGILVVIDDGLHCLQLVADILAKSLVLETYERHVAQVFDRVEPLAERLREGRRGVRRSGELIQHIGDVLQIQHRMVGRAEVGEKPDLLWERPELERLYSHLEHEYEVRERQLALERKLRLISDTAETLLDLMHAQRSLRVEWYIVILILVEIGLTLYELFVR